jgi:hypothetical protein
VIHDHVALDTPDEMAAIDVFNDLLQAEGHWVFAGWAAANCGTGLRGGISARG